MRSKLFLMASCALILPSLVHAQEGASFRQRLEAPILFTGTGGTPDPNENFPAPPVVAAPSYFEGTRDSFWSFLPTVTTGPVTSWSLSPAALPWMAFDPATGALSGTPTVSGPVGPFTLTATNEDGSDDIVVNFPVRDPLTATLPSMIDVVLGNSLGQVAIAGGDENYSVEWITPEADRPAWLSVTGGVLSGTQETGEWTDLDLEVTDGYGRNALVEFALKIRAAAGWFGWGDGSGAVFGDSTTADRSTPAAIAELSDFVDIVGGDAHSCGIKADQTVWCWGKNNNGQLSMLDTTDRPTPTQAVGGTGITSIAAGGDNTCMLKADRVYCTGQNNYGQIGNGNTTQTNGWLQVGGSGNNGWTAVSVGSGFACGLKTGGVAYCWGRGNLGALGNNGTTDSSSPVLVSGGHSFASISAGGYHACGLKANGEVWCWGYNAYGEGGGSAGANNRVPVQVLGGTGFASISAGGYHNCGIKTSGGAYCWGYNVDGQLGINSTTSTATPTAVVNGAGFDEVETGTFFSCGIKDDGGYCWGNNAGGQVGDGTTTNRLIPVAVLDGGDITKFGMGADHVFGYK